MKEIPARSITTQEAEILDLALKRGALVPVADALLADMPALKVVGICTCGCRSIYFEPESRKDQRLAARTGCSSAATCCRKADGHDLDSVKWPCYPSPATLSAMNLTSKPS